MATFKAYINKKEARKRGFIALTNGMKSRRTANAS